MVPNDLPLLTSSLEPVAKLQSLGEMLLVLAHVHVHSNKRAACSATSTGAICPLPLWSRPSRLSHFLPATPGWLQMSCTVLPWCSPLSNRRRGGC